MRENTLERSISRVFTIQLGFHRTHTRRPYNFWTIICKKSKNSRKAKQLASLFNLIKDHRSSLASITDITVMSHCQWQDNKKRFFHPNDMIVEKVYFQFPSRNYLTLFSFCPLSEVHFAFVAVSIHSIMVLDTHLKSDLFDMNVSNRTNMHDAAILNFDF